MNVLKKKKARQIMIKYKSFRSSKEFEEFQKTGSYQYHQFVPIPEWDSRQVTELESEISVSSEVGLFVVYSEVVNKAGG